jgi:hypothetical protein
LVSRQTSTEPGFWTYATLVRTHMLQEFNWLRDMLIATAIAVSTAWMQIHYRFVESTQSRTFWVTVLAPYVVVLGLHLVIRACSAPYHLHREKERELFEAIAERDRSAAKLEAIERARPRIVVRDIYADKVAVNQNGMQVCLANVLRAKLENAPSHNFPSCEAKNVTAMISFYDSSGKLLIEDMDARWTASTQPVGPHWVSVVPLLGMDFGMGSNAIWT